MQDPGAHTHTRAHTRDTQKQVMEMWSAFAFLSAFLRVAQTPIQTFMERRSQPCRPWSLCVCLRVCVRVRACARLKWAQSDILACVVFSLFKSALSSSGRGTRSSCWRFPSVFSLQFSPSLRPLHPSLHTSSHRFLSF